MVLYVFQAYNVYLNSKPTVFQNHNTSIDIISASGKGRLRAGAWCSKDT